MNWYGFVAAVQRKLIGLGRPADASAFARRAFAVSSEQALRDLARGYLPGCSA